MSTKVNYYFFVYNLLKIYFFGYIERKIITRTDINPFNMTKNSNVIYFFN